MLTNFYIDGFNLYKGSLQGTPHKWLDFLTLFNRLLPDCEINRIRYFTALVKPTSTDPKKRQRQQTYLRAIRTTPNLSVHLGYFQTNPLKMPLARPRPGRSRMVDVLRTEEKGTDVNLASYLLLDAFRNDYEQAVVVSNDTDLLTPIKIIQNEFGLSVGVLNPQKKPSRALKDTANFYRQIRQGTLSASQFPTTLTDATGTFHKPPRW